MTSPSEKTAPDRVFSEFEESAGPDTRRLFARAVLLVLALVVVAGAVVYWVLGNRERQLLEELERRTEIISSTRAEVIGSWLRTLGSAGQRLSHSEVFRLFAAEAGLTGGIPAPDSPLAAQLPYMEKAITEYARERRLAGAYLVGRDGRAILASTGAPALTDAQRAAALGVFESRDRQVSPARDQGQGLVVDVMLPVAPPQETNPRSPETVAGVFLFATPVQAALARMLAPSPLLNAGERTRIVQISRERAVEVVPNAQPGLVPLEWGAAPAAGAPLPFASRPSVASPREVFSAGAWVGGMPWLVVHEIRADRALAPLRAFGWGVVGFAVVVTLLLVAAFTAFWWHQASDHSRAMAEQYRTLGSRIEAQRRFLESLMATLTEMVALKDGAGSYLYVNPSFAKAVGRAQGEIAGLGDAEVFGRGTALALEKTDQQAREGGKPVMAEETIHLPSGARHLQITKVPYEREGGAGVLSVARDVTELREAEAKREAAFREMSRALVRTIESVDPYLAGHTQHVHEVSLGVAHNLGLDAGEVATIDIAAQLAQIGKVSIPKEIVAKAGRLTPEEQKVMQSHVASAVSILEGVDFGLPVIQTLSQVYERLDGSGYPEGLQGDQVGICARVLGIADIFCARIERRSYRSPISPEEALSVLEQNDHKYDPRVVAALREFVGSIEGEKLIARITGD